jgi:hypothetical protein
MRLKKSCYARRPASDAASEASSASAQSWCVPPAVNIASSRYVDPPAPPQPQQPDQAARLPAATEPGRGVRARIARLLEQLPKLAVAGAVVLVAGVSMLKVRAEVVWWASVVCGSVAHFSVPFLHFASQSRLACDTEDVLMMCRLRTLAPRCTMHAPAGRPPPLRPSLRRGSRQRGPRGFLPTRATLRRRSGMPFPADRHRLGYFSRSSRHRP